MDLAVWEITSMISQRSKPLVKSKAPFSDLWQTLEGSIRALAQHTMGSLPLPTFSTALPLARTGPVLAPAPPL